MSKKSFFVNLFVFLNFVIFATFTYADSVEGRGENEVSIKESKGQVAARALARKAAERDAVRSALKLRLNINATDPKSEDAINDMVKNLAPNLKTTFVIEDDVLRASSILRVDSAELTDLARTLNIQNQNVMEAATIVFLIDEYWGIATNIDPTKPITQEVQFFQDLSSSSDTSSKSSGSAFSDTSSKSASSSNFAGSLNASSKEASAYSSNQKSAAVQSSSTAVAGSDKSAIAVQNGYGGSGAAASNSQYAAAQKNSAAASSSSSVGSASSSDTRIAASVNSSSASASDRKNIQAGSFSEEQKNIQNQTNVTSLKTKTVFPDVNNAKPQDAKSALISARLAQITQKYGLVYTSERDMRETGKGKMLIADIEAQQKFAMYTEKAGKNPYNAKYIVFGEAVSNTNGTSAGVTTCSGMLKLNSANVDTGRGLIVGTLTKVAQGRDDADCRNNLSTALATELAQTVGNAATRELQRIANNGEAYTVSLFSMKNIPRRVGSNFDDALKELAGENNLREIKSDSKILIYTMTVKGADLKRRISKMLDKIGDAFNDASVETKGNRLVVCLEGTCPSDY